MAKLRLPALLALAFAASCSPAGTAGDQASSAVDILPVNTTVGPGGIISFQASCAPGETILWSVQEGSAGGTITQSGVYTAPATPGTYHVVATSQADGSRQDLVAVTVTAAPVVAVSISPRTPSVVAGGKVTFQATVTGTTNTTVAWTLQEGAAAGAISAAGIYTAPSTPGTYHVVATSVADSSRRDTVAVVVTAAASDLAAQFAVLSGKAIFFGHQSVGANILDGIRDLEASNSGAEPTIDTSSPPHVGAGIFAQDYVGSNGDPISKIDAFKTILDRQYNGRAVGASLDVAMMKFCWVDFDGGVAFFDGGGTPATLFAAYQAKIAQIKASYPNLRIVHFTAPLFTNGNPRRHAYNQLVRAAYGGAGQDPLLDLARIEATDPTSGSPVVDGNGVPALYSGYTSDGGHLNVAGRDAVARELIRLLASL